jgi:hypothetical protein
MDYLAVHSLPSNTVLPWRAKFQSAMQFLGYWHLALSAI